jgi:butyrate kinase
MLILVINPGSTSTKISVYDGTEQVFTNTLRHSAEELAGFSDVVSQFDFRKKTIISALKENKINTDELSVVIARGGLVKPLTSGVYKVNAAMLEDLRNGLGGEHASNLGGLIADDIAKDVSKKTGRDVQAYIADPVVVDEMDPVAKVSGNANITRTSIFHALNQKAIAKRFAKENGKKYEDLNLIVAHLGGGVSVGMHKHGRVVDVNNALDGEGPFSPERSGGLPAGQLVEICFNGKYSKGEVMKMINGKGGIMSYLGTNSFLDVSNAAKAGDKKAAFIIDAFAYQLSKEIGSLAPVVEGKVDAILITGGIAYNKTVTDKVTERVKSIAPVYVYPGEDEMGALAQNAYSVLTGEEKAKNY